MISPEGYYEMELKGKSAEEIAKKIRGLKNEIGHLKKTIENPDYGAEPIIHPDECTRLWCSRLYLERAIAAYEENGGIYQPSKAEQRAASFDAAIPKITRVIFRIGGFYDGYETRTITLTEDYLQLCIEHLLIPTPTNFDIEPDYPMTREEFLKALKDIHIGEWRRYYDSSDYGVIIMDGTQWELIIEYANGRKVEYGGSNAYPFSFDAFCEIIGYEKNEDVVDEEGDE